MSRIPHVVRAALVAGFPIAALGAQQPGAAGSLHDRAVASLAAGQAAQAVALFKEDAARAEQAKNAAAVAASYDGLARAYAALSEPDSVLTYVGRSSAIVAGDSTSGRVARLLDASPALHPSRSLTEEARFIRSVRALLSRLPGGEMLARRVGTVREAESSLERISEQHRARVRIVGDVPGVEVAVIRYALRTSPGILPTVLQTDTVVYLPAVAYQFRYRLASGRDTVISRPCALDCQVRIVSGTGRRN